MLGRGISTEGRSSTGSPNRKRPAEIHSLRVLATSRARTMLDSGMIMYSDYDSAMFLAYLTIIPSMAIFMFSVETNFFNVGFGVKLLLPVAEIFELGRNANGVPGTDADNAVEHVPDLRQLTANMVPRLVAFEGEGRGGRHHAQT